jgi:hypothetical protein
VWSHFNARAKPEAKLTGCHARYLLLVEYVHLGFFHTILAFTRTSEISRIRAPARFLPLFTVRAARTSNINRDLSLFSRSRACRTKFSGGVILQNPSTGDTQGASLFRSRPQSRINNQDGRQPLRRTRPGRNAREPRADCR